PRTASWRRSGAPGGSSSAAAARRCSGSSRSSRRITIAASARRWRVSRIPAMRRLLVISAALACALVAAGCGNKMETGTQGATQGVYIDVDDPKYQNQTSRYMNPADGEDKSYLIGLPASTPPPGRDETY